VIELKGFERIQLDSGERRKVSFTVGFDHVKFWKGGGWISEPGDLELMLGSSSEDIRLRATATITSSAPRTRNGSQSDRLRHHSP
jgi:beta-glucosidase